LVRKSFGDPVAEELRFVVKSVVGEENFIDMTPNMSNNYCCGGGGGYLQSGYTDARHQYGKIKFDQIKATGAPYCITPCHNCRSLRWRVLYCSSMDTDMSFARDTG